MTRSFFDTPTIDKWSYAKGGKKRLIDYILVSRTLLSKVTSAGLEDSIGVGSDHRTAMATLIFDNMPS